MLNKSISECCNKPLLHEFKDGTAICSECRKWCGISSHDASRVDPIDQAKQYNEIKEVEDLGRIEISNDNYLSGLWS